MIIAREKKRTNIAEYILYMWQIEDLIRANQFNTVMIEKNIINPFDQPGEVKNEMREWYANLITTMEFEGVKEKGHISHLDSIVDELENLHKTLIRNPKELEYADTYDKARPGIEDLKKKSQGTARGDIEACLHGLYGVLLLKLQNKAVNPATREALDEISNLIALLNDKYFEIRNQGSGI
jgi:flagellin-specific chaperone FliS